MRVVVALGALILIEVGAFVVVGQRIGLWWTLSTVLASALIGGAVLRGQMFGLFRQIADSVGADRLPSRPTLDTLLVLIAALLLLIPGFVTDMIGAIGLIAFVREAILERVGRSLSKKVYAAAHDHPNFVTINGTARFVDPQPIDRTPEGR